MVRTTISIAFLLIATDLNDTGIGATASDVLTDQSKPRHIALSRGTRIPAVITPTDEFVILERDRTGSVVTVAPHIAARKEDLDERVRTADVIAVVEVTRSKSLLVNNDTWIETDVSIVVRQWVTDTGPTSLKSDASITFRHSGGELYIGQVRVRADPYYFFKTGEQYLVFLRKISREQNVRVGLIGFPFRITGEGRLAPVAMSTGELMAAPSALFDLDLKTVIAELTMRLRP